MSAYATPSWVQGLKAKRPLEWIRALGYLIDAGLRNGQVTANDIPADVRFEEPNVIGANFKDLKRLGFRKTNTTIKAIAARKHGRDLPIWVLDRPDVAKAWLRDLREHVLNCEPTSQLEMF